MPCVRATDCSCFTQDHSILNITMDSAEFHAAVGTRHDAYKYMLIQPISRSITS
jgi:hypothetical protein